MHCTIGDVPRIFFFKYTIFEFLLKPGIEIRRSWREGGPLSNPFARYILYFGFYICVDGASTEEFQTIQHDLVRIGKQPSQNMYYSGTPMLMYVPFYEKRGNACSTIITNELCFKAGSNAHQETVTRYKIALVSSCPMHVSGRQNSVLYTVSRWFIAHDQEPHHLIIPPDNISLLAGEGHD